MAERKPFLLRLDPELHAALQRWADDELRSLNGQIEFLLRKSLRDVGRSIPTRPTPAKPSPLPPLPPATPSSDPTLPPENPPTDPSPTR